MLSTGKSKAETLADCGELRWGQFKPVLAEALVEHLGPIQKKYKEVVDEPGFLDQVLRDGAAEADRTARWTLFNAYESMGFSPRPGLKPE